MPDFFVFSKVLPILLYPLPLVLILVFAFSWAVGKSPWRWWIRLCVLVLWVASTPWLADWTSRQWETPRSTRAHLAPTSDVAVVLGGLSDPTVSTPEHWEFNRAAERITEAVSLWKEGRVKALLISSGSGELLDPSAVEAPELAAWARSMGVPATAILVESRSRNTYENAQESLRLVRDHHFHTVVLVTSAVHMPRAAAVFRKAGFDRDGLALTLWPVDTQQNTEKFPVNAIPEPTSLGTVQNVLREVVGFIAYGCQGYL